MVGIGTVDEDASNALLVIDFREVGFFKGGGWTVGAVDALLECECGGHGIEWNAGASAARRLARCSDSFAIVDSRPPADRSFRTFQISRMQDTRHARKTRTNKTTCSRGALTTYP